MTVLNINLTNNYFKKYLQMNVCCDINEIINGVNGKIQEGFKEVKAILEDTQSDVNKELIEWKDYMENSVNLSNLAPITYVDEKINEINDSLNKYATIESLTTATNGMLKSVKIGTVTKTSDGNGQVSFTSDDLKNVLGLSSYLTTNSSIPWSKITNAPSFITSHLTVNDIKGMGFAVKGTSDIGIAGVKVNNYTTLQGVVDFGYLLKQVTWSKNGVTQTWSPSQNSGVLDLGEIGSVTTSQASQVKPNTGNSGEQEMPIVEYTTNPSTATLEPNKLYRWKSATTSVNVTIQAPSNTNCAAVYTLRFKTGSSFSGFKIKTPTGKILTPYDITWNTNTEYEVGILFDKYAYTLKQIALNELGSGDANTAISI